MVERAEWFLGHLAAVMRTTEIPYGLPVLTDELPRREVLVAQMSAITNRVPEWVRQYGRFARLYREAGVWDAQSSYAR